MFRQVRWPSHPTRLGCWPDLAQLGRQACSTHLGCQDRLCHRAHPTSMCCWPGPTQQGCRVCLGHRVGQACQVNGLVWSLGLFDMSRSSYMPNTSRSSDSPDPCESPDSFVLLGPSDPITHLGRQISLTRLHLWVHPTCLGH